MPATALPFLVLLHPYTTCSGQLSLQRDVPLVARVEGGVWQERVRAVVANQGGGLVGEFCAERNDH